jgi:hypothetical protein
MREISRRTSATALALRSLFALLVLVALAGGIVGGLLRAGVSLVATSAAPWNGHAVVGHAFLMMCGFLGTVIGIERAVAVRSRLAFVAPAASGLAGVAMLLGLEQHAVDLAVLAALAFVAVGVVIWQRQRSVHTTVLLAGAMAWLVGNLLLALEARAASVVPWWFCFLVLTIAAERLEMTRLTRRHRAATPALLAPLAAMLAGAAAFSFAPVWGGWLFGLGLLGLAAWLLAFDIARRTVRSHGLSRYMAVCLLLGYAWLAVAGIAWMATAAGFAGRDMALHALGLGFVFSMILGHAPVIVPALVRVKLLFGWPFYAVLAFLHASLALRLVWGAFDLRVWSLGAAANAAAILLFAMTIASAAIAWRVRPGN